MTEFERSAFEGTRLVAQPGGAADDARRAIERCHVLLSDRGEVSGERLANEALAAYEALEAPSLDVYLYWHRDTELEPASRWLRRQVRQAFRSTA